MTAQAVSKVKKQLKKIARPTIRRFRPAPVLPLQPVSTKWGEDRGTPVDRYFIEKFLEANRADISKTVLEVKDSKYTERFGQNVSRLDVLDIDKSNSHATVIADLAAADAVPSDTYDCFILTETLHVIYDVKSAIEHACRILKPGGVLLATAPCISALDSKLVDIESWRFTGNSFRRLFGSVFGDDQIQVETYGNFATSVAFLSGVAIEEMDRDVLQETSDIYVQGVCVRAEKRR